MLLRYSQCSWQKITYLTGDTVEKENKNIIFLLLLEAKECLSIGSEINSLLQFEDARSRKHPSCFKFDRE